VELPEPGVELLLLLELELELLEPEPLLLGEPLPGVEGEPLGVVMPMVATSDFPTNAAPSSIIRRAALRSPFSSELALSSQRSSTATLPSTRP
jgi:hypothetical protein